MVDLAVRAWPQTASQAKSLITLEQQWVSGRRCMPADQCQHGKESAESRVWSVTLLAHSLSFPGRLSSAPALTVGFCAFSAGELSGDSKITWGSDSLPSQEGSLTLAAGGVGSSKIQEGQVVGRNI